MLVSDTREPKDDRLIRETLTVGDYVIMLDGVIEAVFERKTFSDYAASLKDDRMENLKKMINLRVENPNIKLYIILEGQHMPGTKYSGITYETITESFDRKTLQYNLITMRTFDFEDTVNRLVKLDAYITKGVKTVEAVPNALKGQFIPSVKDIIKKAYMNIPGVGEKTAEKMLLAGSIADHIKKYPELKPSRISVEEYSKFFDSCVNIFYDVPSTNTVTLRQVVLENVHVNEKIMSYIY
jgi:ERCC4-type nuclease